MSAEIYFSFVSDSQTPQQDWLEGNTHSVEGEVQADPKGRGPPKPGHLQGGVVWSSHYQEGLAHLILKWSTFFLLLAKKPKPKGPLRLMSVQT